jgi:hypothetical protein
VRASRLHHRGHAECPRMPAERVLLYGSRARGDYGLDGNADVAVILPHGADDQELPWMHTGLAYEVFGDILIMIQLVSMSSRDWADPVPCPRPSFLRSVARDCDGTFPLRIPHSKERTGNADCSSSVSRTKLRSTTTRFESPESQT